MRAQERRLDQTADSRQRATRVPAGKSLRGPLDSGTVLALQSAMGNRVVSRLLDQEQHVHGPGCSHDDIAAAQRGLVDEALRSPGRPIEMSMRKELEAFHQTDLSAVRVHTGPVAQRSAAALGARAYTVGEDIVLGPDGNDEETLGHEARHVKQQRAGAVAGTDNGAGLRVSHPADVEEQEAASDGAAFASGAEHAPSIGAPAVQRAASGDGIRVQRVHGSSRTVRESTRHGRDRDRRDPRGRTRGGQSSGSDPIRQAERVAAPTSVGGRRLWDGRRDSIGFQRGVREAVLQDAAVRASDGQIYHKCARCGQLNHAANMDIDHIEGIISYVIRSTDEHEWTIQLNDNPVIYRNLLGVYLDDARNAANDRRNLRALCWPCNNALAPASASRNMDTSGPGWYGSAYYGDDDDR